MTKQITYPLNVCGELCEIIPFRHAQMAPLHDFTLLICIWLAYKFRIEAILSMIFKEILKTEETIL
jgi:hypothetical protein